MLWKRMGEQYPTSELPTSKEGLEALIARTQHQMLLGLLDVLPNMYGPYLGFQEIRESRLDIPDIPTAEEDLKDLLGKLDKFTDAIKKASELTSQDQPLKVRIVGEKPEVNLKDYYPQEEQGSE